MCSIKKMFFFTKVGDKQLVSNSLDSFTNIGAEIYKSLLKYYHTLQLVGNHRKKLTNVIIREMHGFPHKFPTVQENAIKRMVWGMSGKLILILFPQYGWFFPIRFPSYGILQKMGNAWVSLSISHSTRKCNKTHRMGRTWEIGAPTFPIVWALFFHQIPILHHMGNACVFSLISHNIGKDSLTHRIEKVWKIGSR